MAVDRSELNFLLLADRVAAVPLVASWLFDEWGHEHAGSSPERLAGEISAKLSRDRVPVHILAMLRDVEVGVAVLKAHEMKDVFPERTPWVGSLYVHADYRGRGIAVSLLREAERVAFALGFRCLHLQTERLDGGLYARLGWTPTGRLRYRTLDVLVMTKDLQAAMQYEPRS